MNKDPFITKGQLEMQKTLLTVTKRRYTKFIETPHGTGLTFAIELCKKINPHIRFVHIDCLDKPNSRGVFVSILRKASDVKFSNLNHLSIALDHLLLVVRDRMNKDLKSRMVLLVIDHIDVLQKHHLVNLVRLLQFRKPPCGILLRTTTEHRLKVKAKEPVLHDLLYVALSSQSPDIVAMTTRDERKIFIQEVHGISNEQFINDLSKNNWGFSKMEGYISRYKEKGGK